MRARAIAAYVAPIALLVVWGNIVACEVAEVEINTDQSTSPVYESLREQAQDTPVHMDHRDLRIRNMPQVEVNITKWFIDDYDQLKENKESFIWLEKTVPLDERAYMIRDDRNASALYREGGNHYYREKNGHILDLQSPKDHSVYVKRYVNQTRLGLWNGSMTSSELDEWEADRCIHEIHLTDHHSNCEYVPIHARTHGDKDAELLFSFQGFELLAHSW